MLEYAINSIKFQQPLWSFTILQAICWCLVAWNLVSSHTIQNCWRHTGLLDFFSPTSSPATQPFSNTILESLIQQTGVEDLMSIENFLNPAEKRVEPYGRLTDNDLILWAQSSLDLVTEVEVGS